MKPHPLPLIATLLALCVLDASAQNAKKSPERKVPVASPTDYYSVEELALPNDLSAEVGGLTFMPDGRLAACFHRGEVYTLDTKKPGAQWTLFAVGLHDPLGLLAESNDSLLVMQRPELTRLRDLDNDGVADQYETVTNAFGLSGNYHEFAFGPVRTRDGHYLIALNVASNGAGIRSEVRGPLNSRSPVTARMYATVPWRGWILKVSPDGKTKPYASGFRSPNGLGFDGDGNLFVTDNQGDWRGTSPLYHVKEGGFYGHIASLAWKDGETRDTLSIPQSDIDATRQRASVLFPHSIMANSPTEPILDNSGGKFGPFSGQMIVGEYNRPRLIRLMLERVGGQLQGACVPFIDGGGLVSGNNRLAFGPDGSLYVGTTTHGWGGALGIRRIQWNGKTPLDVKSIHLTKTGFTLTFTKPVQREAALRPESYRCRRYWYADTVKYGSPQNDVEQLPVGAVNLSADRLNVSLEFAGMIPGRIYEINIDGVKAEDGDLMMNPLVCYTANRLLP
jgi:glucose/arabinose dehydrogenase